ncbi:putative dihydrolipoamide acyltransferase [Neospora caninum Liverpool]|nr:putative dihydrolipoamide acyltransferase [Neospora caninum Liverpool]CBZ51675.1 putative dihydrolipoamide acyltransferase [Neospora caninum Liverpool]|eukprot:XP_003881708.1 putative dihydrolipoamide acyltransferase [Neospora caninum Liverpool]
MGELVECRFFASAAATEHVIKVPSLGDSITEGGLLEWRKKVGDFVAVDEVVCVIETDKVTVEIHSDCSGVLLSQAAQEGDTVHVGSQLAVIDYSDAAVGAAAQVADASAKAGAEASAGGESGEPSAAKNGLRESGLEAHQAAPRAFGGSPHGSHESLVQGRRRTPHIVFKFGRRKCGAAPLAVAQEPAEPTETSEDPLLELWGVPRWRPLGEAEMEAVNLGGAGSAADALGIWSVSLNMQPPKPQKAGKNAETRKAK